MRNTRHGILGVTAGLTVVASTLVLLPKLRELGEPETAPTAAASAPTTKVAAAGLHTGRNCPAGCSHETKAAASDCRPEADLALLVPMGGVMPLSVADLNALRQPALEDHARVPITGGGEIAGKIVMADDQESTGWWIRTVALDGRPGATLTIDRRPDGTLGGLIISPESRTVLKLDNMEDGMATFTALDKSQVIPECSFDIAETGSSGDLPPVPEGSTALVGLSSRPDAGNVLYLDFDGERVANTWWNAYKTGGNPIEAAETGFDADTITQVWRAVSEDFRPFNVNVTTSRAVYDNANPATRMMNVFTPSRDWYTTTGGTLGVAYLLTFGNEAARVCWTFTGRLTDPNDDGLTSSHELGHTLGLNHDTYYSVGYYSGHGFGDTGWGPIMGNPFGKSINQWSDGTYDGGTNFEDDVTILATLLGHLPDGNPDGIANARLIETPSPGTVQQEGMIESRGDSDVFRIDAGAGSLNLFISPFRPDSASTRGTNLDVEASLLDVSGNLIVTSNPTDSASAAIVRSVARGTYYLRIDGGGLAGTDGYSDYGSLGNYAITGTHVPPQDRLADIDVDTTPIEVKIQRGQSYAGSFEIRNVGEGDLHYSLAGGELALVPEPGSLWNRSPYRTADPEGESFSSRSTWTNIPIPEQPGSFKLTFDITTSAAGIDGVTGLSEHPADEWADLSAVLRANPAGYWDGWKSSSGYGKDGNLNHAPGVVYQVEFDVNVQTDTYVLSVTPEGGSKVRILNSGRFRRNATALRYLSLWTKAPGAHTVSRIRTVSYTLPTASNPASAWINLPIPLQSEKFEISYDVTTSGSPIDGVTGFSESAVTHWADMAVALRANPSGHWDAHTGGSSGSFQKDNTLPYQAAKRYRVFFQIDIPARTYRVTVTPEDGIETVILEQGTFRSQASCLEFLTIRNVSGSQEISNVRMDSSWYFGDEALRTSVGGQRHAGGLVSLPFEVPWDRPSLMFEEWLETDGGQAWIEVRKEGTASWTRLSQSPPTEKTWCLREVDLSDYSGEKVRVRFHFDTMSATSGESEGWYVDRPVVGGGDRIAYSHPGTTVAVDGVVKVDYVVRGGNLLPGIHHDRIAITSNDPDEPVVEIPLIVKVNVHESANDDRLALPASGTEGPADDYPSEIEVYGLHGVIGGITVKIDGFSHAYPSDMDLLLVGPGGQKVLLMSGAGGDLWVSDVDLGFIHGTCADRMPDDGMESGTWLPASYGDRGSLPGAPGGPYLNSLDAFIGTGPNGHWKLYAHDRVGGDTGSIQGWSVEFTMIDATDTFELWSMANLGIDSEVGNDDSDPDGDSHPNLLEYALGLDPRVTDHAPLTSLELASSDGGRERHLGLRVNRQTRRADVDYIVEISRDLAEWNNGPGHTLTLIDTAASLYVCDPSPMSASSKGFMRLRVERRK